MIGVDPAGPLAPPVARDQEGLAGRAVRSAHQICRAA